MQSGEEGNNHWKHNEQVVRPSKGRLHGVLYNSVYVHYGAAGSGSRPPRRGAGASNDRAGPVISGLLQHMQEKVN